VITIAAGGKLGLAAYRSKISRWLARLTVAAIALSLGTTKAAEGSAPPPPAILGVHPYLPVAEIQRRFAPLANYLATSIGRPVQVRVGRDYQQHIDAVGLNLVDIAIIGPAAYVKMTAHYGQRPLLARLEVDGQPFLSGYIFTRADSTLRDLTDLRGKRFAFSDPESTMGSIVPRHVLLQAGITLRTLGGYRHLGSQNDVVLGVLNGDFDAGAVPSEVFDEFATRGLRGLLKLPDVSEHVFVTRADLPAVQVALLRQALLQLKGVPNGNAILRAIHKNTTGMVVATDAHFDSVRKIHRTLEGKVE
jgi:phosphonate transport system substrate-binding protein